MPMTHEIQQLMQSLRLPGMRAAYEGLLSTKNLQSIGNDELLNLLLQAEWDERENSKVSRRLQNAKFRMRASIEEIDFLSPRGLDKTQLLRFTDGSFVKHAENILITGQTGIGKSYIASALGITLVGLVTKSAILSLRNFF